MKPRQSKSIILTSIVLCLLVTVSGGAETLVPAGATWSFLDDGSNQGTAWRAPSFDDASWATGPAELGYGDGQATPVSFGPDPNNKYVTTYFRHTFNVVDAAAFTDLTLRVLRDDGVIVYLNGTEIRRDNMSNGDNFDSFASAVVGGADESTFFASNPSPTALVEGANVLAVEIHQANATSSDISFNLILEGTRPPISVVPNSPAEGAIDVSIPATLDVTATDPEGDNLEVTFYGRVAPPAAGPDFTIIAMPDTQFYASSLNGGDPATFVAQTDWIIANQASRNIVFTTQLGDCVQNGDNGGNDVEWRHATNAFYRIEDPTLTFLPEGIPYGIAVGNHDQSPIGDPDGTTTFYNQYFGVDHFLDKSYYGGHHGSNNDNHYQLFSGGGLDFIIVHLEYDTSPDAAILTWADNLLQTFSNRRAIIVTHHMIGTGNPASFGTQGQAIYDALKGNPNLFLMLGGHVAGEGRRSDTFNGNTVHTLLSDYQNRANGGDGWLRIMEFSPANNEIRVKTYSPTLGQFEIDSSSDFVLPYDMAPAGPAFTTIQVNSGVASGTPTTANWSGLDPQTEYEWYASASDGGTSSDGPARRFTTTDNVSPSIAITAPADLGWFETPVNTTITADASDSDGSIAKVEFFEDGISLGEDLVAPYSIAWTPAIAGVYNLTAVAHDDLGATTVSDLVRVTVTDPGQQNQPPTVSITNPIEGAEFSEPANITIDASATDSDGIIVKVEFFEGPTKLGEDLSEPFSFTWTSTPAGSYSLSATAHDNLGLTTASSPVNVTVTTAPDPDPIRGPYLQVGTSDSLIVQWRTAVAGGARVRYGASPGTLDTTATDPTSSTDHAVQLTGLTPNTQYYYQVGSLTGWSATNPDQNFVTAPSPGTAKPTRVWVLGDSGTADANSAAVRDSYLTYAAGQPTDVWLMLGDNAYNNGTDSEYQLAVFDTYPGILPNTVLWPAIGNHDNDPAYFDIFTLPTAAEAGGVASGTENYYSFDYGNIHFICLDSFSSDRSPTGPMLTWLNDDLLATTRDWIVAYWHHPPYTKGSHNSDTESQLIEMRVNALPILEAGGVDLVLAGHSHSYERSFLLDGHYDLSSSFDQSMIEDGGDGRSDGDGVYRKPDTLSPYEGAVYVVAGASGKISGGTLDHPAMFISLNVLGSVVIDVAGENMDVTYLNSGGVIEDYFTISKPSAPHTTPAAPSGLLASTLSNTEISLQWTDNSNNENNFSIERSTDGVNFTPVGTVGANLTEATDTGLTPSTTYFYRVQAVNGAVPESPYSNINSAETLGNTVDNLAINDLPVAGTTSGSYVDTQVNDGTAQSIEERESGGKPANRHTYLEHKWLFNVQAGDPVTFLINAWAPASPEGDTFVFSWSSDNLNFEDIFEVTKTSDDGIADAFALPNGLQGNIYIRVIDTDQTPGNRFPDTIFVDFLSIQTEVGPPQPPDAPSALSATAISGSQIDLAWTDNSFNEDGFEIERSLDGVNFGLHATVGADITSYSDTGLTEGTTYYYQVRAVNAVGDSAYSNTASATASTPPPTAPSGLSATAASSSQVDLAWTDNSANEDNFEIERSLDGVNFSPLTTVGPNVTTYSDTGLTEDTTYFYRVRAVNTVGNSEYSNTASATTPGSGSVPNPPSDLTATALSTSEIDIAWSDNSVDEDGFKIERSENGTTFTEITTVGADATAFSDSGLRRNRTYYYRVRAYNTNGDSPYSNVADTKTLKK